MNAINTTPENNTTSQPIGTTLVVNGTVQAQAAANGVRTLQVGSPVFLNDRIITGNDGMISIVFGDAARTQLDLGRMSDVVLNEDTLQYALPEEFSDAVAEVEQIQEALLAGTFDPTTDLEPTAAGPAAAAGPASDGGGSSYVEFSLTGEEVTPTSGAETTGVGLNFLDPPISELEEPIEAVPEPETEAPVAAAPTPAPDSAPTAGDFSSFVDEEGLIDGSFGLDPSKTTTGGTLADLGIDFGGDGPGFITFSNGSTTITVVLDGDPATSSSLTGTYGTLTIFGNSTWQYTITDNTIDHSGIGLTGAADTVPDFFTFTVFDSDGDSASGTLTIDIYDDGPVATGAVIDRVVEEEELDNFSESSSPIEGSDGNPDDTDGPEDATQPDATVITGSLSSLVNMGADNPGTFGITLPPGLPALSSQGGTITYELNGTTLEAWVRDSGSSEEPPPDTDEPISEEPISQDRLIFTFDVQSDGTYTFTLLDQLDHVSGDGENSELAMIGGGSVAALSFGNAIIATDADGDPTTFAPEALQITIVDDVPILVPLEEGPQSEFEGSGALLFVQEDALGNTTLNPDNFNDDDDSSTGNLDHDWQTDHSSFDLSGMVKVGADENLTWSLSQPEGDGESEGDYASTLTSKGETVYYHVDGNTLTGYTGTPETMNVVFTFTVDATTGRADFNLNDQLDHSPGVSGTDYEILEITDLGDFVNATDFDGDSVNFAGLITIAVENDFPGAIVEPRVISATVLEDGMSEADGDLSEGNKEGGETNDSDEASGAAGSLSALFSVGADEPADYGIADGEALGSLATLYSKGEAVSYSSDGTTLTATAGGRDVFTFTVNNDGSWAFDLKDQLDHVDDGANDENFALITDGEPVDGIDFSSILTITDFDGDTVTGAAEGSFMINVQDDIPVAVLEPNGISATVLEDGMSEADSDLSEGNKESGETSADDEASGAAGSLSALFSVGADEPVEYGISDDDEALGDLTTLYSKGEAVSYSSDGTTLTATAGGRDVFTLTVNSDGSWAFDLKDQLDHVDDGNDDENQALITDGGSVDGIDFSSILTVTDEDGDTATGAAVGSFMINVEDDIPVAVLEPKGISATVLEDGMSEADGDLSEGNKESGETSADDEASGSAGSLSALFTVGADEPAEYGISEDEELLGDLTTLYSKGEAVSYSSDGTTLTATAGGRDVFTLTVNNDGSWAFDLKDQLDHVDNGANDENQALVTGGEPVNGIDFSSILTVTDEDGDTVTGAAEGSFMIKVEDDIPIITLNQNRALGAVQEDALGNELVDDAADDIDSSVGNLDTADDTDTATLNLAELLDTTPGADEPASIDYSIKLDNPVQSNYTSGGQEVWYYEEDGKLVARAGDGGNAMGTVVFTFAVDAASGVATFDLDDQLDHSGNENDDELLAIDDLGSYVEANITDADNDTVSLNFAGKITVKVENDLPTIGFNQNRAYGAVQEDALGNELVDDAADDIDSSVGNLDTADDTDTATLNLAELLDTTPGADEPASIDYSIKLDNPVQSNHTSNGQEVWYYEEDGKLVARAGDGGNAMGTVIFTFAVDASTGVATFNLDDQLDHSGNENDGELLAIDDLGSYVEANITDADNDTLSLNFEGKITVNVENDLPTIGFNQNLAYGAVQEDALGNELVDDAADDIDSSVGNLDTADDTDTATLNLAELLATTPGADEPASIDYSIKLDNPVQSNHTSNGQEVWYYEEDGKLVARAGDGGNAMGTVVFTFAVDASTGVATFNLDDQLDHSGNENDGELLAIDDLGSYVEASITDADNDTLSLNFEGKITVNVENDLPTIGFNQNLASGAVQEDALGNELVDDAADDIDSSVGNLDTADDTDTATLNLAELLATTPGADEPASIDYSIKLDNPVQSNYTSGGQEVWYYEEDGKLVARAGDGGNAMGTVVFTFAVDASTGVATFDLDDQLDHSGNENDGELLAIDDLGSYVEASITDADNDTLSLNFEGKITVNVENDLPTIGFNRGTATGAVQEDALGNELVDDSADDSDSSVGNLDTADDTDTATLNLAELLATTPGADEPASIDYSIKLDNPVQSNHTSNGQEVWYYEEDGKLVARAGDGGNAMGTVVFTFAVDASTGVATFDLDDQLDHSGNENDDELLAINDLGSYVEANITDADNDTVSLNFAGKITVKVENDLPTIGFNQNRAYGAVQEDALGNELVDDAADDIDSSVGNLDTADDTDTATLNLAELLDTTPGADEPASIDYSIKLDNPVQSNYTSGGQEVWYYEEDGKLVARAGDGGNAMGTVVFTFAVDASTGVATFDLDDQLDHSGNENDDELLAINDLGSYVEANITDADNDSVSLNFEGKITVKVENDLPTIGFNQNRAYGAVQEDALGNELVDDAADDIDSSVGNLDTAVDTDTATLNLAELLDTTPGADEPASIDYSIKLDNPVQSNYTSGGQEVWYYEEDGKLVARAGDGGNAMGTVVFTFAVDASTGVATFDLDDQLDHSGNENDDELLAIDDLGSYVEANITDADNDTVSLNFAGKITVKVENDLPTIGFNQNRAYGAVQEDALGNELVDDAADDIDSSVGNLDTADDTDTATLNLAELLDTTPGADEPASIDYSIKLDNPVQSNHTSNGQEVWYYEEDGKLVARAGDGGNAMGTVIFTFAVDASTGVATFNLDDQLDHSGNENDGELLAIDDLGSYVEANITDADNDTVSLNFAGKITVKVENDLPTIGFNQNRAYGAVQEDALGNELVDDAADDIDSSVGNLDTADDTDTATLNLAELLDTTPGADEPASIDYSIKLDNPVQSNHTSNGQEVWYYEEDGKLVARAGDGGNAMGTVVFTFAVDASTGVATFNLDDQLDHSGNENDDELLAINDLGSYVEANITDADNDTVSLNFAGKITVKVENDIPQAVAQPAAIVGTVLEDGLSEAEGDLSEGIRENGETIADDEDSGSSNPADASNLANLFDSGADESLIFGISTDPDVLNQLDTLYSQGDQLYYLSDGTTLEANTAADGSGRFVFSLEVNSDGSWNFDLKDQLDHVDDNTNSENWALEGSTATAGSIDFSSIITATDADGDTTTGAAPNSFRVEVQDDIPEAASTTQVPGNMNLVLILDNSGSMYSNNISFGGGTVTRAEALQASVVALLTSLATDGDAGSIYKVHIVEYNTDSASLGTFTITGGDADSANAAIAAIQGMNEPGSGDVYTNYEAGYQQALQWVNSGDPLTEADVDGALVNQVLFISDGDPNRWNDPDMGQPGGPDADGSGGGFNSTALNQVIGSDGSNEITALDAWADSVRAIGLAVSDDGIDNNNDQDDRLDTLDLTGNALNITSGDQLLAALPELIQVTAPIISTNVEEDDMTVDGDALTDPDSSTGINEDGSSNADEASGSTVSTDATNLANLFITDADEELTYSISSNLGGLPTLYSGGTALTYGVAGNTLTASAGAETIFTFTVNPDGSWSFDLDGQLDHVAGDGENFELRTGDGSEETSGIDLSSIIVATDADGDELTATTGAFVVNVQDDVPDIGTPQDSLMAIEEGNSLTASLDIIGSGADDPLSITLKLTEGAEVKSIGGANLTSGGDPLFWHQNPDGSWSAVTESSPGILDPDAKSFTVSVDGSTGTYSVTQNGVLDGNDSTTTISFGDNLNGGNPDEAVFGDESKGTANPDGSTTYSGGIFLYAAGSLDLSDPFGWDGADDNFGDAPSTVNYSAQGIGVGNGQKVSGTGSDAGSRESDILSLKLVSQVTVESDDDISDFVLYPASSVTIHFDHLGYEETAYVSLWLNGQQVSGDIALQAIEDDDTENASDPIEVKGKGGDAGDEAVFTVDSSMTTSGTSLFDEIRFEAGSNIDDDKTLEDFRVVSLEISSEVEGSDQTVIIPFEVTDADGDSVGDDFSITFDGHGTLNAEEADEADGDDSTNGMVISGSSLPDDIIGTDYNDAIDGNGGNDTIDGGEGDDTIEGGTGDDLLVGNVGDDVIYGDEGDDELEGGAGEDQLIGGEGEDTLEGGEDDDTLVGDDVDFSTPADPVIVEDDAPDVIDGGAGDDTAGDQTAGPPANNDTITTVETTTTDIDTLVPPPDDEV